MINILINNIGFVNPTSLIRALRKIKKYDIKIWGTDSEKVGHIPASLFVDHYIQTPNMNQEKEYTYLIDKICRNNKIDFIIPGSDKDVQFYGKNRKNFSPQIVLPEEKAINLFVDKYKASVKLYELGFSIPPFIDNLFNEEQIIFRKKISSSSNGIQIVDLKTVEKIPNLFNNDYFLQRYINGDEYTVDVFADQTGNPVLIIPRKRLKIKNGMSVCCQLCYNEDIINICKRIYRHFFIPGLTNVQFIDDGKNIYFLELNMRFAGSGICGIAASFNYVELYLDHFMFQKPLESFEKYMSKVAWTSIISRYFDESVYSAITSESSKS